MAPRLLDAHAAEVQAAQQMSVGPTLAAVDVVEACLTMRWTRREHSRMKEASQ